MAVRSHLAACNYERYDRPFPAFILVGRLEPENYGDEPDTVDGFLGREWHGGILTSMLGQEDRQQERGILDPLDGV
jgi:hypothetical protein